MEKTDDVIRDLIDFINLQSGAYMDSMSGFSGNYGRVSRQVHRINRATGEKIDENGHRIITSTSYEDPSQPDVIVHRILRSSEYLALNSEGGGNEQQIANMTVVYLFTFWEDEIRPRLAAASGRDIKDVRSDIFGDLRVLRNVILHSKSVIKQDKYKTLKVLKDMFQPDQKVFIPYEGMHKIFVLTKQECTRIMKEWLNVPSDIPLNPEEIVDIAIQRRGK